MTVPWESTVTFVTRPENRSVQFLQWEDYSRKNKLRQVDFVEKQDDCMNAHPYAELLVVVFSSIKNDFKEHSGAQTDSKPLFLH